MSALGGQYGGVIALEPASGQVLGVAGIGLDALQPPGSTFKMITVSGVLGAGIASPRSTFPYQTASTLDGVALHNANGESCGGSLVEAFAASCNSVFAPLGVKLGAARLVATAEKFGFNHPTGIAGARTEHDSPGRPDPGRTGVGLHGDRPGPGAGEPAGDGDRGGDDRRRGAAPRAEPGARRRRQRRA